MIRGLLALAGSLLGLGLVAPLILLGLPFWAVATLTRAVHALSVRSAARWPDILEFDPVVGWKAKPNLACYCTLSTGDVFRVMTDSQGWAGKARLADSEVVVFGDSHAFGYGVDAHASFSELTPHLRVKPIGVPGYNMVQELLVMEQLSSRLTGKLVMWFVYVGNDLLDNLSPEMNGYRMPFVRSRGTSGWEIVTSHLAPGKWTASSRAWGAYHLLPELYSETYLAARAYAACEFLLEKGRDVCARVDAQLVAVVIPAPLGLSRVNARKEGEGSVKARDLHLPDKKIGEMCNRLGIACVALSKSLDLRNNGLHYKERDDHWTEEGHRRVAEVLQNVYRAKCEALAAEVTG